MTWDPSIRTCLGKANRPDMVHLNTEAEKCISSVFVSNRPCFVDGDSECKRLRVHCFLACVTELPDVKGRTRRPALN